MLLKKKSCRNRREKNADACHAHDETDIYMSSYCQIYYHSHQPCYQEEINSSEDQMPDVPFLRKLTKETLINRFFAPIIHQSDLNELINQRNSYKTRELQTANCEIFMSVVRDDKV